MPARLDGKRVLITGTGGGQGRAALELFVREGARVVGCDLQPGTAEAVAEDLRNSGFDAFGATVDLTVDAQAQTWVEESADRLGGIDVVYNNAAHAAFASFSEMTFNLWTQVFRTEVDLVFHVTRAAWPHLISSQGSLINTSSAAAKIGIGCLGQAAHSAAKGAVLAFTRSLAAEGARYGVRANSISPGLVVSPGSDASLTGDALRRSVQRMHLLDRVGSCEDVAGLALYLASDESSWLTGQDISIDGGWTAGFR